MSIMTARCASCSYPLSVSDSVSCYECSSYFHIDCAQLVGFPYYELSSDPNRNTFHCSTCKLLPLPSRQYDSDSDSDSDCAMPSRQLDYHLEGQVDFAKDMNEIKGTVQDLSELCKDMLREINDLKSVNLTLRCCIENLRQDNEQRDKLISDLKFKVELLDKNGILSQHNLIESLELDVGRFGAEREEDTERYLTPDPEYAKLKELESLLPENVEYIHPTDQSVITDFHEENTEKSLIAYETEEDSTQVESEEQFVVNDCERLISETNTERNYTEPPQCTKSNVEDESYSLDEENLGFKSSTDVNAETISEAERSVKDWDWKGNKAIEIEKEEEEDDDSDVEELDTEGSEVEDTVSQNWEILDEEFQTESKEKDEAEDLQIAENVDLWQSKEDKDEFEDQINSRNLVKEESWEQQKYEDDEAENPDEDIEASEEEEEIRGHQSVHIVKNTEETEDKKEEAAEGVDKTSVTDEEATESALPNEGEAEKRPEGAEEENIVEDKVQSSEEARLEGEPPVDGEERLGVAEGEQSLEGQSPQDGEVQSAEPSEPCEPLDPSEPCDLPEPCEPPVTPEPAHTEEDLWEYLKETVTSVHPATVEEFVQGLIGTLQHVPQEYLKPVIDANIKRANSPSVTDGDHLTTPDGLLHVDGQPESGDGPRPEGLESLTDNEGISTLEGERTVAEGDAEVTERNTSSQEASSVFPEDTPEATEDYSAVEGALFGGFWVIWFMYSMWKT